MQMEYILGAGLTVLMTAYLLYALFIARSIFNKLSNAA